MSNVRSPQVTVHNVGKPPGISIFAKIATEHVLGHEIFVYTTVNVANVTMFESG